MSGLNPELEAMSAVSTILEKLDEQTKSRVVNWVADKYSGASRPVAHASGNGITDKNRETTFSEFVDLYDHVDPSDQAEKALTGAYWFQVVKSEASWQAQGVNSILKDTGNGLTGISHVFERLQARKPALVRQIVKSGKTRQARKTYKLTSAGIKLIDDRISSPLPEESK
ncbi:MAG: hypothetical protein ABIQ04_02045 [Candidatus Saccharimonadales bacterium]